MASSWFLVLIPTKKYEMHLQTLNMLDSNDKSRPDVGGEIKDLFCDKSACKNKIIINEPTEEEKYSGLRNSFVQINSNQRGFTFLICILCLCK